MISIRAAATAAAILVFEYLLVSVLFDATPSSPRFSWLAGSLGFVVPFVVSIASAACVLARPVAQEGVEQAALLKRPRRPPILLGAIHLCIFAAFLWATARFFAAGTSGVPHQVALLVVWVFLGAAAVLSLATTVFEPAWLLDFVRRKRALLLVTSATGIAAFCAGRAAENLWASLGSWTLSCVAFVLRPILADLIVRPEQLIVGTPHFLVEIAPVCSGYEGIGLISAFVAAYLVTARDRVAMPAGLVLFPIGIAAAWSANVLRIAGLIWVGSRWSAPLAAGGLHSKIGWLLFCAVAVGLVLVANRTALLARDAAAEPKSNPAGGHLLPFVALAATTFIVAIPSEGHDALRPLRLIAVALALWVSRADRPALELSRSWNAAALGVVAFVLATALERLTAIAPSPAPLVSANLAAAGIFWAVEVLTLVVAIPIACELAFRGYLLRRITSRSFAAVDPRETSLIALITSACAYAAVTGAFWTSLPAGLLYGLAYRRRGRLGDAVLAHAVANALSIALAAALP